jgi:anti-anti-sigma factor
MPAYPEIQITRTEDKAAIQPNGDITAANSQELRSALKSLVADNVRHLVIDLQSVRLIDSTGIGLIVAAHNSLERLGGNVAVINASADLLELFKVFRLDKHFSVTGATSPEKQ